MRPFLFMWWHLSSWEIACMYRRKQRLANQSCKKLKTQNKKQRKISIWFPGSKKRSLHFSSFSSRSFLRKKNSLSWFVLILEFWFLNRIWDRAIERFIASKASVSTSDFFTGSKWQFRRKKRKTKRRLNSRMTFCKSKSHGVRSRIVNKNWRSN